MFAISTMPGSFQNARTEVIVKDNSIGMRNHNSFKYLLRR